MGSGEKLWAGSGEIWTQCLAQHKYTWLQLLPYALALECSFSKGALWVGTRRVDFNLIFSTFNLLLKYCSSFTRWGSLSHEVNMWSEQNKSESALGFSWNHQEGGPPLPLRYISVMTTWAKRYFWKHLSEEEFTTEESRVKRWIRWLLCLHETIWPPRASCPWI